jgi:hypothetical protein
LLKIAISARWEPSVSGTGSEKLVKAAAPYLMLAAKAVTRRAALL